MPSQLTPRALKRAAREQALSATIISDGSREYLVAIQLPDEKVMLQTSAGQLLRFASLEEAKQLLLKSGVQEMYLEMRVAAAEACAGSSGPGEPVAKLPL